jgi:hypothetical protein
MMEGLSVMFWQGNVEDAGIKNTYRIHDCYKYAFPEMQNPNTEGRKSGTTHALDVALDARAVPCSRSFFGFAWWRPWERMTLLWSACEGTLLLLRRLLFYRYLFLGRGRKFGQYGQTEVYLSLVLTIE